MNTNAVNANAVNVNSVNATEPHYFSLMYNGGRKSTHSYKLDLRCVIADFWKPGNLASNKGNGRLMAMGYVEGADELFSREESVFTHMSVMMIDCDNKTNDPHIVDKFRDYLANYEYWIYETASSTKEHPTFRAFIPLDRPVRWTRYNKKAIGHLFHLFVDMGASWFEEPLSTKLHTLQHHDGKMFSAATLEAVISKLEESERVKEKEYRFAHERHRMWMLRNLDKVTKVNVSNNEKVRHYLDTPYLKMSGNGDSDNSLYRAICVCVVADDEDTLELVKTKARCERWTTAEIERKVREARRYVKH